MRQHEFYDTTNLTMPEKEALLRRAFALKFNWWADKLDCSESWRRQKIDASFESMMARLSGTTYVTVIHRKDCWPDPEHIEVGYRTMSNPVDYFLWIQVGLEHKEELTAGIPRKN